MRVRSPGAQDFTRAALLDPEGNTCETLGLQAAYCPVRRVDPEITQAIDRT